RRLAPRPSVERGNAVNSVAMRGYSLVCGLPRAPKASVVRGGDNPALDASAGKSFELYAKTSRDGNSPLVWVARPAPGRYSVKSELTDSSFEMRVIVSARSCAHESTRMRLHAFASSESGIVSVTTISSISESAIRPTAPPERTGCVQ